MNKAEMDELENKQNNRYRLVGEIEYRNMLSTTELDIPDFLWINDNNPDQTFFRVGPKIKFCESFSFNNYNKSPFEGKATIRKFLRYFISVDRYHGKGLVQKIVDRKPLIRLKGNKTWIHPDLDFYNQKTDIIK